jgi:hypothetical protein
MIALVIAILAGLTAALLVHQLAWYARLRALPVAVTLGGVAALALVLASGLLVFLFIRYPASGADGAYVVQAMFTFIWAFVLVFGLVIGTLQARSLEAPWWKGVLGACFEAGLAFLVVVAANYTLQWFAPQFERLFLETTGAFLDRFIKSLALSLVALAVVRPVVRLNRGLEGRKTGI